MPRILIVEDEKFQRTLIRETLVIDPTLEFFEAENGRQGLDLAEHIRPDVVLLDIMMPVMDGLETCRRLKADPVLRTAPVILITAMGRMEDRVQGLDCGADDFINKPFEELELQARVRSALRIKALADELIAITHTHDSLVRMLMHDMGNLVSVIGASLTVHSRLPVQSPQAQQFIRDAYEANAMLGEMIADALDVARFETRKMPMRLENVSTKEMLNSIVDRFRGAAEENDVVIDVQIAENAPALLYVDNSLIRRVIGNLLTNALKFAPKNTSIVVTAAQMDERPAFCLTVRDSGPGIPQEELASLFNKYEQAHRYADARSRSGRGLGLTFSKMAVEAHGGIIYVESTLGAGAAFTVEIPLEPAQA